MPGGLSGSVAHRWSARSTPGCGGNIRSLSGLSPGAVRGGDAKAGSECARKVGGALGPVGHGARCVLPCRREGKGEAGGSLTCRELAQGVR